MDDVKANLKSELEKLNEGQQGRSVTFDKADGVGDHTDQPTENDQVRVKDVQLKL